MAHYLISLDLLPQELSNNFGQEKLLNELGDPYELRTKGLDEQLKAHEFGRVLLHFVDPFFQPSKSTKLLFIQHHKKP
jgi:CRISPR-associated endonuclease Csn1